MLLLSAQCSQKREHDVAVQVGTPWLLLASRVHNAIRALCKGHRLQPEARIAMRLQDFSLPPQARLLPPLPPRNRCRCSADEGRPWTEKVFLPTQLVKKSLGVNWIAWENLLSRLPTLLDKDRRVRRRIQTLPRLDLSRIEELSEVERWRAMQVVSFLSHAYVWGPPGASVETVLPSVVAEPWCEIGRLLDVPPVMSYATYVLLNCHCPSTLPDEVRTVHTFTGTADEEWFVAVHVAIEAIAETVVSAVFRAKQLAIDENAEGTAESLYEIASALRNMRRTLCRMTERCDPSVYNTRIRRFLGGWRNNPEIVGGLNYEGVGSAAFYYGASGAQSSVIPLLDAFLGVAHSSGHFQSYLEEIRGYMPREHRDMVRKAKEGGSIREFAERRKDEVGPAYDSCLEETRNFRWAHRALVKEFTVVRGDVKKEMKVNGTGGTTDALDFLRQNAVLTGQHLLRR